MQEEVHGLSERLVTVALDERPRIARDLHDGTGQHIIAAEMALARIETSSARKCGTAGNWGAEAIARRSDDFAS